MPRCIVHVDLDAFYASVEQMDDPQLRGKPVLVGGLGPRSVVTTASYEARVFGCRSAMPMGAALRLCPQALVVRPRFSRYHELSEAMFAILADYSPLIQPISLDEAFIDLTGCERLHGSGARVAQLIRQRVRNEIGLTVSAGVAENKFLAKLASDLDKPDGLTIIDRTNIDTILPPLPINKIWGVGPRTAGRLNELGIRTFGDLRKLPFDVVSARFGSEGEHYHRLAHGIDERQVIGDRQAKSIGQEQTFGTDIGAVDELRSILLGEVEQVSRRLRRSGLRAGGISLKLRDGKFNTITRAAALDTPTDLTQPLWLAALAVFDRWAASHWRPLRLLGMTAIRLGPAESQLALFGNQQAERDKKIDSAADQIAARFGQTAIFRASAYDRKRVNPDRKS